jgi:hypothetical protein
MDDSDDSADVMIAADRSAGVVLLGIGGRGVECSPADAAKLSAAMMRAAIDLGFRPGVDAPSSDGSFDPPARAAAVRACDPRRRRRPHRRT